MRLAVINLKGGVGKTTTSVHVAAGLGREADTLLIDADPQGSASRWAELADELPHRTISHPRSDLARRVDGLGAAAEHVVIDTPPGDASIVRSAASIADVVIVPVEPLIMDLDHLETTVDLLRNVEGAKDRRLHILLTRVRSGTRSAKTSRELLIEAGLPVLETQIPMMEAYGWGYGRIPPDGHYYGLLLDELNGLRKQSANSIVRALTGWLQTPAEPEQPGRLSAGFMPAGLVNAAARA